MWQVVLGIYLIVNVFCGAFLWSSLMLAKETDHQSARCLPGNESYNRLGSG